MTFAGSILPSAPLVEDAVDPNAWLIRLCRRRVGRNRRPPVPTKRHLMALLTLIFDGCAPVSSEGNSLVFELTLDPALVDLIAEFGVDHEDYEPDVDDEDGHDQEGQTGDDDHLPLMKRPILNK